MEKIRPTRAEINLDNLKYNFNNIKQKAQDKLICCVVKADAYGHGQEAINFLDSLNPDYYAVAFLEEAIVLRENGIKKPIMLLGYTFGDRAEELIENNIEPTIYDLKTATEFSKAALKLKKKLPVHLKIDTGMGRIGLNYKTAIEDIKRINQLKGLELKGIFTHFATADEADKNFTNLQLRRFNFVLDQLEKEDIYIPIKHAENSAAIMEYPCNNLNMVRPGIILYGHYPSKEVLKENLSIKPVMNFLTKIIQIKELQKGDSVGYGRTFIAEYPMKVATFPAGYADGYSRMLSHKNTDVLINGQRARILGNICMDQAVCDVSNIKNVSVGDDIELFGENLLAQEIADKLGTIPYEVTCMVSKRVPRVYIKENDD